jgi:hypothetical protein
MSSAGMRKFQQHPGFSLRDAVLAVLVAGK